jgi:hypothetical protein
MEDSADFCSATVRSFEDVTFPRCEGITTRRMIADRDHTRVINGRVIRFKAGIPRVVCCFCGTVPHFRDNEVAVPCRLQSGLFRSGGWWDSGSNRR